jgi:hypothetical protein
MILLNFSPSRPTMADGAGEASPQGQATLQPGAEEAEQQQQEELAQLGLRGRDGQTQERWPERRQLKHLTGSLQEAARWFEARQMKQRPLMRSRNSRASSRPQRSCLESRLLCLLRRPSRRIEWGLTSPVEHLRHQYGFLIASCESVGRAAPQINATARRRVARPPCASQQWTRQTHGLLCWNLTM